MKFTHSTGDNEYETILTAEEAARFTVANIFGTWAPDAICAQQTTTATISDDKHTLTWDATTRASRIYLVSINGETPFITQDTSLTIDGEITSATVRVANARGGFGPAATAGNASSIDAVNAEAANAGKLYNLAGMRVSENYKGIVIQNGVKTVKR